VITDGDPLIVGQQRTVRSEQPTHRRGMVDGRIKVRVVADSGGNRKFCLVLRYQAGAPGRRCVGPDAQRFGERAAQRRPCGEPHFHE
jgi:hypothetical protein